MSFSADQLKELDINELPFWPRPFRLIAQAIIAIAVMIGGYYLIIADQWTAYQKAVAQESTLKDEYRSKYLTAVNLPKYREQLEQLNRDLETLLAMLPNTDETPKLLDDITLVGTQVGLRFDRIEWLPAESRDFYTALPMRIELKGDYHQIGQFIGDIASLHRIVSVKNFTLRFNAASENLTLNLNAETYQQQTLRAQP